VRRTFLAAALAATVTTATASIAAPGARAAEAGSPELMQAAEELGRQYDANYNSKNATGMAALYASDGILVLGGPVIRGADNLKPYYQSRFDAGASNHATKIVEVHALGQDGAYAVGQFSVVAPTPDSGKREVKGNLGIVYRHVAEGWRLAMVTASVPPAPPPK
jgi:uncharacterized protein (TIGR02246 family)